MKWMRTSGLAIGLVILVQAVAVWGQTTHYVVPGNPDAAAPFTNWATAAATIQPAIDVATDGDTILATNGTYALTNTIWITNGITLRSVNGAANTEISGQNQVRCLYVANTNAVVEGFTVTAGYVFDDASDEYDEARNGEGRGGGIYVSNAHAIRSCVVKNCEAKGKGATGWDGYWLGGGPDSWDGFGLGGGIYVAQGGLIENCVIWGNRAEGIGGDGVNTIYGGGIPGDGYGYGAGVFLESNALCEVRNCTIIQNQAIGTGGVYEWGGWPGSGYGYGGGIAAGTNCGIYNSVVWSNAATTASSNWSGGSFGYSCSEPRPDGIANIEQHPALVDFLGGDFHLTTASPCLDAGVNQSWMELCGDLDGNPRIRYGVVDMGAYEYNGSAGESYRVAKIVQSPHDARAAQVGETVRFTLIVVNLGDVALAPVPVEDRYETAYLTYISSVPASADNADDGIVNWANVGPLAPGVSTSIVATFTARASTAGQPRTNNVVATPVGVAAKTNTAPYRVSRAGYLLEKTIQAPHDTRAAATGETVRFTLTVINTGDVALATVPLSDLYETNYLTYGSSVPGSADNVNDGTINWADVGPLAPGVSTSIVATFTAKASTAGQARTNMVVATPTTPTGESTVSAKTNLAPYSIVVFYTLTVNGGTGGGSYTNQQQVAIAANPPAIGMTFDRWTGNTQYVETVVSSNTTVTMPAGAVNLTATYKNMAYILTVNGGTGGGSYTNQQRVIIEANTPDGEMIFDRWTGDTQFVASVVSLRTAVTMPPQDATLTATHRYGFDYTTNSPDTNTITITDYYGLGGEVAIPPMIEGKLVTSIGSYAFQLTAINDVTIPDGVTNIGSYAFMQCYMLNRVTVPSSVTSIGNYAFAHCGNLSQITISDGVKSIGDYAFLNCMNMASIVIPPSVSQIGDWYVFGNCSSLTSIVVDVENPFYESLYGVLFNSGKTTLIQYPIGRNGSQYIISEFVISIANGAFSKSHLIEVTFGVNIANIGLYAFSQCTDLAGGFFLCDAPSNIGLGAFEGANNMTVYYLPRATNWPPVPEPWADRPTALWLPEAQDDDSLGVQAGKFGFNVEWAEGLTVVVEGATNLFDPEWIPLATNTFTGEAHDFRDPGWTNYPGWYYRIRSEP